MADLVVQSFVNAYKRSHSQWVVVQVTCASGIVVKVGGLFVVVVGSERAVLGNVFAKHSQLPVRVVFVVHWSNKRSDKKR